MLPEPRFPNMPTRGSAARRSSLRADLPAIKLTSSLDQRPPHPERRQLARLKLAPMPAACPLASIGQLPEPPCRRAIALGSGSTLAGPPARVELAGSPPHIPRCTPRTIARPDAVAGSPA